MSSPISSRELSQRRAGILQLVVQDYIETATPVASRHVVEKYALPASPATIRHEMHALEEGGYLTHPHTSAGRVPSNLGYRHFVQSLMGHAELGQAEQAQVRHQFFQAAPSVDEWVELAANVLARSLGLLVIVAPPHPEQLRIRQLELISLNELLVLMIVVVQEARMIRQLMPLPQPVEVDELDELAARLSGTLRGQSADEVRAAARASLDSPDTHPVQHFVLDTLAQVLHRDARRAGVPAIAGLGGMVSQPEFQQEPERSLELIELVDQQAAEDLIPPEVLEDSMLAGEMHVLIGDDYPNELLQDCSLVLAPYGSSIGAALHAERAAAALEIPGYVGIVGPTRMNYPRSIAAARFYSGLLQEMIDAVYGAGR
ncbi:MAG: heat-inducible transcriptional repressor HrcA [Chloroflexi bacterium]|nr:heat-inducible transcriptional repressor HrcA [Chloroflexota bacterium]